MAGIIHQARPAEEQAELAALTGNERSRHSSQRSRSGGFLRQLFCCFTGSRSNGRPYRDDATTDPSSDNDDHNLDSATSKVPPMENETPPDIVKIDVPSSTPLLAPDTTGKICAVIDLDETLVHSSFKPIANADFRVPVEIEGVIHQVYVLKRPYVDEYLARMGELFECVLFTASLAKYADEVANEIDPNSVFSTRLFRDSCVYDRGNYVKDLSKLGRELSRVIIIDNSPASYLFQQQNAVPVSSWFDDKNDRLLLDIMPDMEQIAYSSSADFYQVVAGVQNRIAQICEGYQ